MYFKLILFKFLKLNMGMDKYGCFMPGVGNVDPGGQGSRQKKSSKEPLAPIREKFRWQIIFLGAAE